MRSAGTGRDNKDDKCPKCKQFIEKAEIVAYRVDEIQLKIRNISKFLADNEWIFLENAELMKGVHDLNDVDMESFDLTCSQIIRFNRYIDKVTRALNQINNESDNFCRGRDGEDEIERESNE
jgi:hypothetical protein